MDTEWLPPQAPGSVPPPPAPPKATATPQPPRVARDDPPNNEAAAAIVCGLVGAGLLAWTDGLSSLVSLILGVFAVLYARKAKRNVAEGKTARHRDMASGALVAGWITVGISLVATAVLTVLIVVD